MTHIKPLKISRYGEPEEVGDSEQASEAYEPSIHTLYRRIHKLKASRRSRTFWMSLIILIQAILLIA